MADTIVSVCVYVCMRRGLYFTPSDCVNGCGRACTPSCVCFLQNVKNFSRVTILFPVVYLIELFLDGDRLDERHSPNLTRSGRRQTFSNHSQPNSNFTYNVIFK